MAHAHVPKPAQIARFQPNVLRNQRPFVSHGSVTNSLGKLEYELVWSGPGRYDVKLSGLTPKHYVSGSGPSSWVLSRAGGKCVLKADNLLTTCPSPRSWGLLELGGQPDTTAQTLKNEGFYGDDDVAWTETHSQDPPPRDPASKRIHLALGRNGSTPVAVLEVRGPQFQEDSAGESHPVIHFDQTFLAPLLMRVSLGSEIITLRATSDLNVSREQPRFSHILSRRIEVGSGGRSWAVFHRNDPGPVKDRVVDKVPTAITDHLALESTLAPDAVNLLRALLLTH